MPMSEIPRPTGEADLLSDDVISDDRINAIHDACISHDGSDQGPTSLLVAELVIEIEQLREKLTSRRHQGGSPTTDADEIRAKAFIAGWLDRDGMPMGSVGGYERSRAMAEGKANKYVAAYKPAKLDRPIVPGSSEEPPTRCLMHPASGSHALDSRGLQLGFRACYWCGKPETEWGESSPEPRPTPGTIGAWTTEPAKP